MLDKSLGKIHVGKVSKSMKDLESAFSPIVRRRTYRKSENPEEMGDFEETPNSVLNTKGFIRKCLYDPSTQEEKENFGAKMKGLKDLPRSPESPPWLASASLDHIADAEDENAERSGIKRSFSQVETSPGQDSTEKKNNSQYVRAYKISDVQINPSTGITMQIESLFLKDLHKEVSNAENLENVFAPAPQTPEKLSLANPVAKNLLCELDDNCEQGEGPDARSENIGTWRSSPKRDSDPSPTTSMEKEVFDVDKSMKELSVGSPNDDVVEGSSTEDSSVDETAKNDQKVNECRGRALADITNIAWASPATTRILPTSKKRPVVAFRSYNSSINASHISEPSRVSVGSMDKIHFSLGCTGSYPVAVTPAQKDRTRKGFQV